MKRRSVLSTISTWLNFGLSLEEAVASKIPVANLGKEGNVLSLVFVGTEIADQVVSELAAAQAGTGTAAPVTPVSTPAS